jgi:peptide/nickel transport system substrate-binding protein
MSKRLSSLVVGLVVLSLALTACQAPTPEVIERTVEVPVEQTVEVPVEQTVVVQETVEVTAAAPPTAEYERSETLYISGAAWGPPSDWNPFITWSKANTSATVGLIYETLFMFSPLTGEYIPFLAESGEWTDANTYAVKLREGLTWQDGEPLTADDVAFTYELGQQFPALAIANAWTVMGLDSIEVVDDLNLEFKFVDPLYQQWDNALWHDAIVPQHLWEERTEEEVTSGANENPVGSGAYMYESHSEDRNVWVRNEDWWGIDVFGLPAPKRIVDIRYASNNVALGSVIKGDLDLSNNFLPGIATLSEQGYVETYFPEAPYMLSANTAVLFLNTTKPPMDDPAFRRALAFSIDVEDIVNVAYANLVKAASPTALLPTLSQYVDQDVVERLGYTYDPDEAAAILAGAGYVDVDGDGFVEAPDGSTIELEVTCPFGWTDWMEAISVIANSAQEAGINVQNVTPDYGAWNDALTNGTFDMTLNNWADLSNTPWTVYNLLFDHPIKEIMGSGNFGRYDDQEMFDLVDAMAAIPIDDEEGMKAACSAIQEKMLTDLPMIPLWYNGMWAQWSNAVWTNWPTDGNNEPSRLPCTWHPYFAMGGLLTLIELEPAE